MRAVVAESGSVRLIEVDAPPVGAQVLRTAEAGICGSDLHMVASGMAPVTMGHEFGGWLADGRLVAMRPTGECGQCDPCRRGFFSACPSAWGDAYGVSAHGGLADEVAVDDERVYAMAPGARPKDAALVEPLAIAMHGLRRLAPEPGDRALVVGAGSIGLLTVAALRSWGVEADIVARHPHQCDAAEALGGRVVDKPKRSDYLCTFDAVCTQQTLDLCVHAAMPGGRVLEFGMFWAPVQYSNNILFKEVSIVPAMGYSRGDGFDDFREAADRAGANPLIADTLVTHTFGLDDAIEAFRVAADRASGAIKVHLVP